MVFGRCFEKALGAYFDQQDCTAALFKNGPSSVTLRLNIGRENPGIGSCIREFTCSRNSYGRIGSVSGAPRRTCSVKITQPLAGNDFLSYIDAVGELDGKRCLIDWKTTTSRYSEEPEGLLSLDPQLICYSWISGIPDVAFVVFVRKQAPEIQYLKATISEEQRREFGRLVETTIHQLESGHFSSHSGIRFPQNGCVSCPHMGLCLGNQQLIETNLIRRPGASDLDWLDELMDYGNIPMGPNLDRRRALLVLDKIDEILTWEKAKEQERDVRFVELGQYLCEVRARQYWRLENLKSFDEFLEKRFPESRRKAYYLMAIHENLTKVPKRQLQGNRLA